MSSDLPEPSHQPSSGDPFSDIPLFREIQRVLMSSSGPVNWELARQVGMAVAASSGEDPPPGADDLRSFEETVRAAELHVAQLTGLPQPADVVKVEVVRRAQWVASAIAGLSDLVEPAAARMGQAFSTMQLQEDEGEQLPPMAGAVLQQVVPLLLGAQAGTAFGVLAQRALGAHEVPVPRPGPATLTFVMPNVAAFERDWSLPSVEFRAWTALREVAYRFEFAGSWVREHLLVLLRDHAANLTVDMHQLMDRLQGLDPTNPEALQDLMRQGDDLLAPQLDDEQRLQLARVQSFLTAARGYAEHVTRVVGRTMLNASDRIEEAVRRGREGEAGDPVFERLLGVDMPRDRYEQGERFCDAVAELTDEATLARMWDSAESLPSKPELEEPSLWLARIV
ncbi:MAG TPA: zinc-dependent metalloprotease [Actinomycetota bacterium]|nr:zinc-dependent metalloprotease [Actinomycetota bacterium]